MRSSDRNPRSKPGVIAFIVVLAAAPVQILDPTQVFRKLRELELGVSELGSPLLEHDSIVAAALVIGCGLGDGCVSAAVVASVRAHPCAPVLERAYGCGPFVERPGAFDLLRPATGAAPADSVPNPEANQPPLFYLVVGLPLRLGAPGLDPAAALLAMRLLSVACVALALFGPLRSATRSWPDEARAAGRVAKAYCASAARTVSETAIQVHCGIGNTWECIAHVFLRRALLSSLWFGDDQALLDALPRDGLGVSVGLS